MYTIELNVLKNIILDLSYSPLSPLKWTGNRPGPELDKKVKLN